MENELVRFSRAGDAFHYRWAARRCLRMIYPKSLLRCIVIEGSRDRQRTGENVIDVAEYSDSAQSDPQQEISYFQLKHTTVRKEQPFNLSDLKNTIEGFAERYFDHFCGQNNAHHPPTVTFSIVSNRRIAEHCKRKIHAIAQGRTVDTRIQTTLEKYTKLTGEHLKTFCASLSFADSEGDYDAQRYELHAEISQLLAGSIDNPQIDSIVALVQERALPNSDGRIVREDILKRFGATSERDLYPAPPEFEELADLIPREQHQTLLDSILHASTPIIIHAAGGVGKSVFARQIAQSLPVGSVGIVYDCFGGGRYRNRSEPRHRYRDALVQIVNELAAHGFCDPLIAQTTALEDEILRRFLMRLKMVVESLRKATDNAVLVILIDAADNAEMAAREFSQPCFVHELLHEQIPDGCRLVALCRTERIELLQPSTTIPQLELDSFSEEETFTYLKRRFPQASDDDGREFHRLTSGNPRVQANALGLKLPTLTETLTRLGPLGTTVEEQIEAQLDSAVSVIKETFPLDYQDHIDAICLGLANLPPLIPLSVLATAAKVDEPTVKSFIADLGRPLWLSDTSVQFRDEPTETWFREKFSATVEQIGTYVTRLEPLAREYPYVAEALPSLLLQAGEYTRLIDLALSDALLPQDNPIDERNVRVYRLQFAFKAALKLKQYTDAIKLALRAGEEVAGDRRQMEVLAKNVDLISPLQNSQRVQGLAFRRVLRSDWDGSENVYSAALLSSVNDFKGEARGYLRAAKNWLQLYFEERRNSETKFAEHLLKNDDIVELVFAYFNLFGISEAVDFLLSWRPPEVVYDIAQEFIRRLIDAGRFDAVNDILLIDSRSQYLMIALTRELLEVGRFPSADSMEHCLTLLTLGRARIPKPNFSRMDTVASALISFAEACAARHLSEAAILRMLRHYVPVRASRSVSSRYQSGERDVYFRAVALRCVVSGDLEPDLEAMLPEKFAKERNHEYEQEIKEFKQIVDRLLPWYLVRARILIGDMDNILEEIKDANQRSRVAQKDTSRSSDTLPHEIAKICIEILTLYQDADATQVEQLFTDYLKENQQIRILDRLKAVRAAYRLDHLARIRNQLEESAHEVIASALDEAPGTRAEWYIGLARAVLPVRCDDAAAYFDCAIEAVSKYGDEIMERWEALAALASRTAEGGHASAELAYRFVRCAELVGDNIDLDYSGALRICARLSPHSALAALSRWRDRDIGLFDQQVCAVADEMVSSGFLCPSAGWSLSAFFQGHGLDDFASLCIGREPCKPRAQYMLDTAARDLRLNEAKRKSWQNLQQAAQQHSITSSELEYALEFYADEEDLKTVQQSHHEYTPQEPTTFEWEELFDGLKLTTSRGISHAIERFSADPNSPGRREIFWQEVLKYIDEGDAVEFLQAVVDAESVSQYDVRQILTSLPDHWRSKISVRRNWEKLLELISRRFASRFINRYTLEYFLEGVQPTDKTVLLIRNGILDGLSSTSDFADASTLFGFVEFASPLVSPEQAKTLLDFALTRFEIHIDDEYADKGWSSWLMPPSDIDKAFAGFVWSALGSPRAETRWRAVHCVRRLAEIGCEPEINALIEWMGRDTVGAFGSIGFPFYNLHARQYLLIALARTSIDNPQILRCHKSVFSVHALTTIRHVLIQKFAAEIALNIEKAFPHTYDGHVIEQLHGVGVSLLPMMEMDSYGDSLQSYWHLRGEVDTSLEYYHGYDFGSYWFEPLGDVFGISAGQVEDLATEVVLKDWGVDAHEKFPKDPRANLWRYSRNERETWHDHGSYPRADNYSFYLSYHAMLVVAAKLLDKMPVIHRWDWHDDEWAEWLHRHSLTRRDGRWLADRRDPAPLLRRNWISQEKTENWRSEITTIDFLDGILLRRNGETWLNVSGAWTDGDSEREEDFYVATALVSPAASQSLLNALTACSDPHDFKLPDYQENDLEFGSFPLILKGWVWQGVQDIRLDALDPHAGPIDFPPYQVGQSIVSNLGLAVDPERRKWFLPGASKESLLCELWTTGVSRRNEDPLRHGKRLSASLAFLKDLCSILQCELIFEVQINRRFKRRPYMRDQNDIEYTPPSGRVFLLSGDGKLRDTEARYQFR